MPRKRKTDRPVKPSTEKQIEALHNNGFNNISPERHKEIASMGGKAAAAKRAYNASFKEAMMWALELPAMKGNPTVDKLRKEFPGLTNRDAMAISMTAEAIKKGNVKAFEAVRDTAGESPRQAIDLNGEEGGLTINIKTVD